MCMRRLSAARAVFLDAESRADSSASKRISLSIPFSRPICSMTVINSRFIPLRVARPGNLRLESRAPNLFARHVVSPTLTFDHQPRPVDVAEPAAHLSPIGEPAPHGLADGPAVLALGTKRSIQSRRGHLEIVVPGDDVVGIEDIADFTTDPLTVRDAHASGLVDGHAQHAPVRMPTPFHVHELDAVVAEHGLDDLFDPRDQLLHRPSRETRHETKKVGEAHFFETLARDLPSGKVQPPSATSLIVGTTSASGTRRSARVLRARTSTMPSLASSLPTVTRTGNPRRSASLNFTPGRSSRSSSRTSSPCCVHSASIRSAALIWVVSRVFTTTRWTGRGAMDHGHKIPSASASCSIAAAAIRAGPMP